MQQILIRTAGAALIAAILLWGAFGRAGESGMTPAMVDWSTLTASDFVIASSGTMATISKDGDVAINWKAVEDIAAHPDKGDRTMLAYARLMLAVRDGTWKPLK